ncbi:EcoKI restriction-modification system protein HsdS [Pirellula sp. SH-Sr6A]|uniref:restriction endonuclease subunit S n=1 Tax=Pirellula sp. SH-Sr6A TaxID=1632865 RepID=UPI00078C6368|nr:restriction endonuclease subunit S [Pirellula sp. SH-Sr6A]AMV35106.1 EcoKI restriction-modification system protein HsdS [Pirellula sp. SH-Sr6A]
MKRLGDVCGFDKSQGIHHGLPYVGLENIESHTGRFIGSSEPLEVKSSTFKFTREHVLYGRLRPYLNKVLAPDFEGHCSTEIFPIKPAPQLSREYLLYWLLADETVERINETCTGARMPRADMNDVLEFDFPLPPPAEQQRIVAVLDEAFAGIGIAQANAARNRLNARALFESHLQSVFSQSGNNWLERPLSELCDIKHGYAFEGEFFSNEGEYVLLTPGNFFEKGGYRDRGEKQKYYTGEIPRDYVLNEGDLLVAMTEQAAGLLGSPIIVPESSKFLHNQRLGLVTKKPGVPWINEFFFHVFNTLQVRKEIHASASGVKVRHTSPKKIGAVMVAFPNSISEQRKIVSTLASLATETQRLESFYTQKLAVLTELKKSLLHLAFRGQL